MVKIIIDQNKCLGCGNCVFLDPDTFELDPESGKVRVKKQSKNSSEKTKQAIASCPVQAILEINNEN